MGGEEKVERKRLWGGQGPLLLLAGVALLSVGLYVFFSGDSNSATDSATSRSDREGVASGEPAPWNGQWPLPDFPPAPPPREKTPSRIIMESIEVNARVSTYGLDEDRLPEIPEVGDRVAWYDFSSIPGEEGNVVFAGHVRWAGDPGAFADIEDLEVGDPIKVVTADGRKYLYAVSDNFKVDPEDRASLQVMSATEKETITLITCGGTWVTDPEKPLGGDFTERVIVRAERADAPSRSPSSFGF